jgi:hypothetical protein
MRDMPWAWYPNATSWWNHLADVVGLGWYWRHDDATARQIIVDLIRREHPDFVMPFMNSTYCDARTAHVRATQAKIWAALVEPSFNQSIVCDYEIIFWSGTRGARLTSGTYRPEYFRDKCPGPRILAFDYSATSIVTSELAKPPPSKPRRMERAEEHIKAFLTAMPECAEWVCRAIKVIVPFRGVQGRYSCSSDPRFPGVLWVDVTDPDFIGEGLVHEAAHKHFDFAEAEAPLALASPSTFMSPLRSEPRSVRSILLAYHALAHIAAYYRSAIRTSFISATRGNAEYKQTLHALNDAERSLQSGEQYLTDAGMRFWRRTSEACDAQ